MPLRVTRTANERRVTQSHQNLRSLDMYTSSPSGTASVDKNAVSDAQVKLRVSSNTVLHAIIVVCRVLRILVDWPWCVNVKRSPFTILRSVVGETVIEETNLVNSGRFNGNCSTFISSCIYKKRVIHVKRMKIISSQGYGSATPDHPLASKTGVIDRYWNVGGNDIKRPCMLTSEVAWIDWNCYFVAVNDAFTVTTHRKSLVRRRIVVNNCHILKFNELAGFSCIYPNETFRTKHVSVKYCAFQDHITTYRLFSWR